MSATSPCDRRTRGTRGHTRERPPGDTSIASRSGRPSRSAVPSPRSGGRSRSRCDAGSASTSGTGRACSRGARIRGMPPRRPRSCRCRSARGRGDAGRPRSRAGRPRGSRPGLPEPDRKAMESGRRSGAWGQVPRSFPRVTSTGTTTDLENAGGGEGEGAGGLSSVRGTSGGRAKGLAAKGFRDFADVVRLALPDSAVRQGLHHTIARKALLADLAPRPPQAVSGARCPMCGAAWLANATRCASCGSTFDLGLEPAAIEQRLQEITGDLVNLAEDEDFQGMPEDVRNEILQAFGGVTPDDLVREEYVRQIEAWRTEGFGVAHLQQLL